MPATAPATARATRAPGTASPRWTGARCRPASRRSSGCAAIRRDNPGSLPSSSSGATLTQQKQQEMPQQRRVLILVENLPSPFDRRVWQEATTLRSAGYGVSIICPTGKGYEKKFESIDGIDIQRYDLPNEAEGALGYLVEYC